MILLQVIFGTDAVNYYNETGIMPSQQWLKQNGGEVNEIDFNTEAEYEAYLRGLSDSNGWNEYHALTPEFVEQDDCLCCHSWRSYFSDNENNVYCPACGKLIIAKTQKQFNKGDKVYWNDPDEISSGTFEIIDDGRGDDEYDEDDRIINISDGSSEIQAYLSELTIIN